ncbi:MAG: response regulator transcription factor [Phycisphaerae bacterium]|nr:MAG: response regulator transcription factor [Phycisphaerae bacterium]MBE7456365.1 response regulator transcription factor [Planctomycetia bacterium]MCK6465695.1 response regulator transcription factor [Phycisphaerae bacterium]MCL4718483.1 response regulator transcription factor [Phycisphaerae bacterium]NUQ09313.1 response regulator transcription factor [Phycisphaerae bacterium]
MTQPARLIVADHDVLLAESLAACLSQHPGWGVVGVASDARRLLDLAIGSDANLTVLSAALPPLGGEAARSRVAEQRPAMRYVHTSLHPIDSYLEKVLAQSGAGYAARIDGLSALVQVVEEVAAGRSSFSPTVRARLADGESRSTSEQRAGSKLSQLTQRQVEAVRLVGSGLSYKEVARAMGIERKTVDNHITSAMQKLDIHSRGQLMLYVFREGLVGPELLEWAESRISGPAIGPVAPSASPMHAAPPRP